MAYYVERGHDWDRLAAAPQSVKDFLKAWIMLKNEVISDG